MTGKRFTLSIITAYMALMVSAGAWSQRMPNGQEHVATLGFTASIVCVCLWLWGVWWIGTGGSKGGN